MSRRPALIRRLVLSTCVLCGACASTDNTDVRATLKHRTSDTPRQIEQIVDATFDSMLSLMAPLYLFYAQNDRWPDTGGELQLATQELGLNFDLAEYSQLTLHELQDGSLLVRFELAPPREGGGEFVLARPEFDDEPVQPRGSERMA